MDYTLPTLKQKHVKVGKHANDRVVGIPSEPRLLRNTTRS